MRIVSVVSVDFCFRHTVFFRTGWAVSHGMLLNLFEQILEIPYADRGGSDFFGRLLFVFRRFKNHETGVFFFFFILYKTIFVEEQDKHRTAERADRNDEMFVCAYQYLFACWAFGTDVGDMRALLHFPTVPYDFAGVRALKYNAIKSILGCISALCGVKVLGFAVHFFCSWKDGSWVFFLFWEIFHLCREVLRILLS